MVAAGGRAEPSRGGGGRGGRAALGAPPTATPSGAAPRLVDSGRGRLSLDPEGEPDRRERREIESHVTQTFRFLSKIPWTPDLARVPDWAYAHHEKLDGSGYPAPLTAAEIPCPSAPSRSPTSTTRSRRATGRTRRPFRTTGPSTSCAPRRARGLIDRALLDLFIDGKVYVIAQARKKPVGSVSPEGAAPEPRGHVPRSPRQSARTRRYPSEPRRGGGRPAHALARRSSRGPPRRGRRHRTLSTIQCRAGEARRLGPLARSRALRAGGQRARASRAPPRRLRGQATAEAVLSRPPVLSGDPRWPCRDVLGRRGPQRGGLPRSCRTRDRPRVS